MAVMVRSLSRAARKAATSQLAAATARLERASAAFARWQDSMTLPHRRRLEREWRSAWEEYRAALVVALEVCPRRLSRGQRLLARVARS